jgi:type II secretory pathway predicted ATPase ExeA/septal ring-binding cell division protein DamX
MSVLYLDHFELNADPFRITPDIDFFFSGGRRGDILEGLVVAALHDDGIVCVIGEVGMGKTMLSRMLMERLRNHPVDTVYLPNPVFDRNEILDAIGRDLLGVPLGGTRTDRMALLEKTLIQRHVDGRRVVVVIDEAHTMPPGTLEEIRLLSNLETAHHKLLKIMLFGQPELDAVLLSPALRQVKDRISYRFDLQPLTPAEVASYLEFRLRKAGFNGSALFSNDAVRRLAAACGGRTRRLNLLADKSLLAAFAGNAGKVKGEHVDRACADEEPGGIAVRHGAGGQAAHAWRPGWALASGLAVALLVGGVVGFASSQWFGSAVEREVRAPAPVVPDKVVAVAPSPPAASGPLAQKVPADSPVAPAPSTAAAEPPPAAVQVATATAAAAAPPPPTAAGAGATQVADAAPVSTSAPPAAAPTAAPPNAAPAAPQPAASGQPAAVATAAAGAAPRPADAPLAARMAASEQAIRQTGGAGFTLQLVAMRAPNHDALETALANYERLLGSTAVLWVNDRVYGGVPHHAVYTGHFATREEALRAADALPPPIRQQRPVARSLQKLLEEGRS